MEILQTLGVKPLQIVIQMLGFVIFVWLLKKYLWQPIIGLLEQRQKDVGEMFQSAEAAKRKSETVEAELKERIAKIDEEAQARIAESVKKANEMAERIVTEARKEAEYEKVKALNAINEEARKVKSDLRDFTVSLSMQIAEKVIGESVDAKKHEDLARNFLVEFETLN